MRLSRLAATALVLALPACGEGDPFGVAPDVQQGSGRIWEVAAGDLPSAFDVLTGRRLFLGDGDISSAMGDFFLDGTPGSTELRLRSVVSLLRGEAAHLVELQDLGAIDFDTLGEVPPDGYLPAGDTNGVPVVPGHVYALRITRSALDPNSAKLVVDAVSSTGDSPDRQFIDFRFAVQVQPGNRRFEEE